MTTEIEKIKSIMNKKENNSPCDYMMTFGKYKGRFLNEIEERYLRWLVNQDIDEDLIYAIEDELERR